jgi:hypothetical protein
MRRALKAARLPNLSRRKTWPKSHAAVASKHKSMRLEREVAQRLQDRLALLRQPKLGRLLDRQIGRLFAIEDAGYVLTDLAVRPGMLVP